MNTLPADLRVESRLKARVRVHWTQGQLEGEWITEDVSLGGMCVRGAAPTFDAPCQITLLAYDHRVTVTAEVAWSSRRGPAAVSGLRFVGVTHAQRIALRRLMRTLRDTPVGPIEVTAPLPDRRPSALPALLLGGLGALSILLAIALALGL